MRLVRRWRIRMWLGLIAVLLLSGVGWLRLLKAPWPVFGGWLVWMALWGILLFQRFVLTLAPAVGRERADLRRAFAYFLFGLLRSLGAVDAGQPRHPSEPKEGPALWLLDARSALAIERDGILARIAGPGLVWVKRDEYVAAFVDLRPQRFPRANASPMRLRTQDGIPLGLEIRTAVAFLPQTFPPHFAGRSPFFFPARSMSRAIAQALRAARVDEDRTLRWFELPYEMARGELSIRIGNRLFDQLFLLARTENDREPLLPPLTRMAQEIQRELRPHLSALGIRMDRLRVTLREVPEEAWRQRVEVWRSQWATRLARWMSLAESEVLLEYARARHASQMEMLEAMTKILSAYPEASPEMILLHFLETLDATVRKSGLALPEELQRLWNYLRGEEGGTP